MRILAIRGKNLASLAEQFEISLCSGPLEQVGLFAITGQTGAGKSTILDALCLALYDKIPRLPDGHGFAVGHKDEHENLRVNSNDVRSILRKGTSHAFAEVDFIGKDKQQYRARWEVNKARGRADGRLQLQDVSLQSIGTGQIISQGKKRALEAISDLIDLSFEQFRRSVLLAQGDFAAFLKAKKDERSSLLERITGTDIYSELSIAAFDRASREKELLTRITEKLQNQIPLDEASRQTLENQRDQSILQLADLDQQITTNQKIIDWYVTLKTLQEAEQSAQAALDSNQLAWKQAEPERALLQKVEAVQPLRPLLSQYESAKSEHLDAQQRMKASIDQQQVAENNLKSAKEMHETASNELVIAERQQSQAQPLLIQARALDTRIEVIQNSVETLTTEENQLRISSDHTETDYKKLLAQQSEKRLELQKLTEWLEQNKAIKLVASEWNRWESELERYQQLNFLKIEAENKSGQLYLGVAEDEKRLLELKSAIDEVDAALKQHADTLKQLNNQAGLHSLEDLLKSKEDLELCRGPVSKALSLASNALEIHEIIQKTKDTQLVNQKDITDSNFRLNQITQHQCENGIALTEAKRALALIEASSHKSAEAFRAILQDDQHCPVCGSLDHPWKDKLNIGHEQASAQSERVSELEKLNESAISDIAELKKHISHTTELSQNLAKTLAEAESKLTETSQEWFGLDISDKPDLSLIDLQLIPLLQHREDKIDSALGVLKEQEKSAIALQNQIKTEQTLLDAAKQKKENLTNEHTDLDKQLAKNKGEMEHLVVDIKNLQAQLEAIIGILAAPFRIVEDWQSSLQESLETFKANWAAKVNQHLDTERRIDLANKALEQSEQEVNLAAQQLKQRQEQHQNKVSELQSQTGQLQKLKLERESVLPGINGEILSADKYEQTVNQNVQTAKNSWQLASQNVSQAETELATQKQNQIHWKSETDRRLGNQDNARNALNQALEKKGIDLEELNLLLIKDDQWIANQKTVFTAVEQALKENAALLKVKTEECQAHKKQAVDMAEEDAIKLSLELQGQKQTLTSQKEEFLILLREDNKKIESGRQLKAELANQQRIWEQWESINELIGSKSGAKFRTFAQSLTLEALLAYSNQHLQDFAKRYILQRVPGSDLELQIVDCDMADDVRSVHSLSGGESFLVSLALALGLASLSSNKTQVESLFIDEGFGSLDPETLDIAIASLDTLQALGRKVGVISHVPILVERIGAKVVVEKQGGGRSSVVVVGC